MANNDSANHGHRRNGAERVVQLAAKWNEYIDTLDEPLRQLIKDRVSSTNRADINDECTIMIVCTIIKFVRQKLVFEMGRQDRGSRFQVVTALIAVSLGCVSGSLLMNAAFGDMPSPIFLACILILLAPFAFIMN